MEEKETGAAQPEAAPERLGQDEVSPPSESEALQRQVQELKARAERLLANWQRSQADLANYRKQVEQEQRELVRFANVHVVASLLPVLDDLERALSTVSGKLVGFTWVDGVFLIYRKLRALLEAQGLKELEDPEGKAFDPQYQQVVAEVEGEPGKVVALLQKGYLFHERLLRPALVAVGKGKSEEHPPSGESPGQTAGTQ